MIAGTFRAQDIAQAQALRDAINAAGGYAYMTRIDGARGVQATIVVHQRDAPTSPNGP